MNGNIRIITGNANRLLAEEIASHAALNCSLTDASVGRFPGGEVRIEINENVRGCDVFVIQPICENKTYALSPNDALMELLALIDAARRSSARRITAVLPYYGYARQDRKDRPRVPITAKLVANMITTAGADRVLTLDLHSNQIQGFYDIPVDHLYSIATFVKVLQRHGVDGVVSPDVGNAKMTRAYAEKLDCDWLVIDKRRKNGVKTEVLNIVGNPVGKRLALIDDLTSTGGTIANAAEILRDKGATEVCAVVIHPVFATDPAVGIDCIKLLSLSSLSAVYVSDSISLAGKPASDKIKIISISELLAEAIDHIHKDESVSVMFKNVSVEG